MKVQQIILASTILQVTCNLTAQDIPTTLLNAAITLQNSQAKLSNTLVTSSGTNSTATSNPSSSQAASQNPPLKTEETPQSSQITSNDSFSTKTPPAIDTSANTTQTNGAATNKVSSSQNDSQKPPLKTEETPQSSPITSNDIFSTKTPPAIDTSANTTQTNGATTNNVSSSQNDSQNPSLKIEETPQSSKITNTPSVAHGASSVQTIVKNESGVTIGLILFDSAQNQINSNPFVLEKNDSTYIPSDAAFIKVINNQNMQLLAPGAINTNSSYVVSKINDSWKINLEPTAKNYTYTNKTNVPLTVKVMVNAIETQQQLLPEANYIHTVDPSALTSVEIHANISPIMSVYNGPANYNLTINNGKLSLVSSDKTGNKIINNTQWPMLINFGSDYEELTQILLEHKNQYQPPVTANRIMIIPCIPNENFVPEKPQSFSITNVNGTLRSTNQ